MTLTIEHRNQAVLNILNDAIIFERANSGINQILSAFNGDMEIWDAMERYNGIGTAYILLGCYGEQFKEETRILLESFYELYNKDFAKSLEDRLTSKELAEEILIEWLAFLKVADYLKLQHFTNE